MADLMFRKQDYEQAVFHLQQLLERKPGKYPLMMFFLMQSLLSPLFGCYGSLEASVEPCCLLGPHLPLSSWDRYEENVTPWTGFALNDDHRPPWALRCGLAVLLYFCNDSLTHLLFTLSLPSSNLQSTLPVPCSQLKMLPPV